jgi:hypothetical protein
MPGAGVQIVRDRVGDSVERRVADSEQLEMTV